MSATEQGCICPLCECCEAPVAGLSCWWCWPREVHTPPIVAALDELRTVYMHACAEERAKRLEELS